MPSNNISSKNNEELQIKSTQNTQRLAFTILAIVQSTLIFTIALITVPLPKIAIEFNLTSADLLLVLAAYGLPFSSLLLFGGRLADRFQGRRMFAVGLLIFGISSVIAGFSPTFKVLVAMRFAQGIGGALTAPAAMAVLRALFPEHSAFSRAMTTWGGVSVLGAVLGFVISGVATTWISWRWMFAIPVLVSCIGLISARTLLPAGADDSHQHRPKLDLIGAILATLGISLSSYGLILTGDHPWISSIVLFPLLTGLCLLVAFAVLERFVRDPLLPPGFIFERSRLTGLFGMFLAAVGSGVINFVLSLYLQQELGWTPLMTATAFLPFAIALIAIGQMTTHLVGRLGAIRVTSSGLFIAAIGFGLLVNIDRNTTYVMGLLPSLILVAVGTALAFSGSAVLSTMNVPQHQAGLAGGVMNTAMELGPTIGLSALMAVAATQVDAIDGYVWAFGTAAVVYTNRH
ncbi:MFS transporter [Xenorhabdus doucetiae]|uniref:MFS transporter n=1 Tax=Xenorhabdus doucetiae TaxID=351671 RepID=A0A068QMM4_9GAMM|nr:MFS transporter [Xenorhabdus doucetiae]TYO95235.1 MFS transporter [Xenorhabdus doucetiae]CDG16108.1 Putative transmembrane efflux protein [Xenorhabdus doucetiae]